MFRQDFKSGEFDNLAVHGNAAGADLTPGYGAADAELLSDKLIKSHEVCLACKSAVRAAPENEAITTFKYNGPAKPLKRKDSWHTICLLMKMPES